MGIIGILFIKHDIIVIPLALAYFAATMLLGLLFISAFSIACPAFIWVPLYQFLYIGYWFWGNILNIDNFPSLSKTPLAPIGNQASIGIFNPDPAPGGFIHITMLQGFESMGLLVIIAAFVWSDF